MITTNKLPQSISYKEFISIIANINNKSILHSVNINNKYTGIFIIESNNSFTALADKFSIYNSIPKKEHTTLDDAITYVSTYLTTINNYY